MIFTKQAHLDSFCQHAMDQGAVAVDTEFMRTSTYYPRLCLIQLATTTQAGAIDPLLHDLDLGSLFDLFAAPVVKVFHAARQDMEIFYHMRTSLPCPLFDTQIGAMGLGIGDQLSYEDLVYSLLGIRLDKSSQRANWAHRPLPPKHLHYAMLDVTHLITVYGKMHAALAAQNRISWVADAMQSLLDPALYRNDPEMAWKRIKTRHRRPAVLGRLKMLAAWRENMAMRHNKPRRHIIDDEHLAMLAEIGDEQARSSFLQTYMRGHAALHPSLLAMLADAPAVHRTKADMRRSRVDKILLQKLRTLLKEQAGLYKITPRLIADSEDVKNIASGSLMATKCASGWRYDLFGRAASDLLQTHDESQPRP